MRYQQTNDAELRAEFAALTKLQRDEMNIPEIWRDQARLLHLEQLKNALAIRIEYLSGQAVS